MTGFSSYVIFALAVWQVARGELCPKCGDQCNDVGFMNCEMCICMPSCRSFSCSEDQFCIMEEVSCPSKPCPPGLPNCISRTAVCGGNPPLLDDSKNPVSCGSGCPDSHSCINGVCCLPATDMSEEVDVNDVDIPDISDPIFPGGNEEIPPFLFFGKEENIDKSECVGCPYNPCALATCPKHMDALCKRDNCSCLSWFMDNGGNHMECYVASKDPVQPALPELDEGTTPKPIVKDENKEAPNGGWKYGLIAVFAVALVGIAGFVVYKVVEKKRKSQDKDKADNDIEEQKLPLKEVVTPTVDNNNQEKSCRLITNSKTDEVAAATSSRQEN